MLKARTINVSFSDEEWKHVLVRAGAMDTEEYIKRAVMEYHRPIEIRKIKSVPEKDPFNNNQATRLELSFWPQEGIVYFLQAIKSEGSTFDRMYRVNLYAQFDTHMSEDECRAFVDDNKELFQRVMLGHTVDVDYNGNAVASLTIDAEDAWEELLEAVEWCGDGSLGTLDAEDALAMLDAEELQKIVEKYDTPESWAHAENERFLKETWAVIGGADALIDAAREKFEANGIMPEEWGDEGN